MGIRNIAEIKAELIQNISVKDGDTMTFKDVFNIIFADKTNFTTDYTEWLSTNAIQKDKRTTTQGGGSSAPQNRTVKRNKKKWFITSLMDPANDWSEEADKTGDPDLVLAGSSLVLAHNIMDVDYPSQLNREEVHYVYNVQINNGTKLNYAKTDSDGKLTIDDAGTSKDAGDDDGNKIASPRSGMYSKSVENAETVSSTNSDDTKRVYTNTLTPMVDGGPADLCANYTPNIWSDADTNTSTTLQQYYDELFDGSIIHRGTISQENATATAKDVLVGSVMSKFYLRKNQPFSLKFDLTETSENAVQRKRKRNTIYNPDPTNASSDIIQSTLKLFGSEGLAPILKDDLSDNSSIIIEWGNRAKDGSSFKYALVFYYATDRWALYKEVPVTATENPTYIYALLAGPTQLKGIDSTVGGTITIYPIGNELILTKKISGQPDDEAENSVTFRLDEPILCGEGKIQLYFYGAENTKFTFFPIYHRAIGYLASDVKNFNKIIPDENKKVNLDYIGKVGLNHLTGDGTISFPDKNDSENMYQYLAPCQLRWEHKTIGETGGGWFSSYFSEQQQGEQEIYYIGFMSNKDYLVISRDDDKTINVDKESINRLNRYYSPGLYAGELFIFPEYIEVNLVPDGDLNLDYIKSASISQTVEGYTGSITLYNRAMDAKAKTGTYTDDYRIKGVKPIKISARIKSDDTGIASFGGITSEAGDATSADYNRLFTGYIVNRNFSRSGSDANSSVVELPLEDNTLRAKDTYAMDLPVFDGYCHLAAFYYLAKYAGYLDDEIVLYQNPYKETDRYRLVDHLIGAGEGFLGDCFDGHTKGFPRTTLLRPSNTYLSGSGYPTTTDGTDTSNVESIGIAGENLHACLPINGIHEAPNYMFQMGTSIWDCMRELTEFSGFYLFANNWGSLVYAPPEITLSPYIDFEFSEMPGDDRFENISDFNEIITNLSVNNPTDEIRNVVITQGLVIGPDGEKLSPLVSIKTQDGWPNNIKDPTYIPWLRYLIQRNPHWNDPKRMQWNNAQMFDRVSRERAFGAWSAWGRALYPYQTFKISETHNNETGANQQKFIASAITHSFSADDYKWNISIEGEKYESKFKFSPHVS